MLTIVGRECAPAFSKRNGEILVIYLAIWADINFHDIVLRNGVRHPDCFNPALLANTAKTLEERYTEIKIKK